MEKIYVFDLDGTLVDSMARYSQGMLSILDEAGIKYEDDLIKIITPLGYTKTAEYYIKMGLADTVENITAKMEKRLVNEYSHNIKLKSHVYEFLHKCKSEGARLFVLTASPHIVTDICLQKNGVFELFEKVWSVEDFGLSKSDTRIFFEVAKCIGCSPKEINYFDDSLIALENAKKAGYKTYGVYDSHSDDQLKIMAEHAEFFVKSFGEIIPFSERN